MSERTSASQPSSRIVSIDALRGLVMLVMIFVNDLGDVPNPVVPGWLKHSRLENGITFVDLVFPAFLFMVGMSIPFALAARAAKGESKLKTVLHVLGRGVSLLIIGILMVNGTPDTAKLGWSGNLWVVMMFGCVILACCSIRPPWSEGKSFRSITWCLRVAALVVLIYLVFVFRTKNGVALISFSPPHLRHMWYGILGYIGWAYLVSGLIYLIFGNNLTALLGCTVLMMCLYPANKMGLFDATWIGQNVNVGVAFGSRAAITALGLLLGVKLISTGPGEVAARIRFALLLTASCAVAALLLGSVWGVSKETATPSWALWGCVATVLGWVLFYFMADVSPVEWIAKPLAIAGQNVLLPYLISEMLSAVIAVLGWDGAYANLAQPSLFNAVARSALCSVTIMALSVGLNRIGFRLRL